MSSVVNEQDYITKKSTQNVSSSYAVAAYNTLFEVVFFLIYIVIFSCPILYWTKIAKSGMLYSLMSGDNKYCSPFINEGLVTNASYDEYLPNKHDDEYIATDKLSLWKKDVGLLTYGKVIKFDYNKNVVESLGNQTFWKKLIFGFNVQNDYKKEESYFPLFNTYSGFGIYYTFARGLTLFNLKVINYIFLFVSWIPIPEALLYILPALAPLYVMGTFQSIFFLLLFFNFIITCLYLIYQIFAVIFYYIGLLSEKVQESGIDNWSKMKIISVFFFWTVIFWISILFIIFIVIPVMILLVMGSLGIYGIFMMVLLAINPLALLFYIAFTFEADICDVTKNDNGKWNLTNDKYSCLTLMKDNFRYKWNWIIFAITLIVLYNILKTYDVSGLNILIVIVILYVVSWTIRNRLVDDETTSNKNKYVSTSYSEDELKEQNMIHIPEYNNIFKNDYNKNYVCKNNKISNEFIDTPIQTIIPSSDEEKEKLLSDAENKKNIFSGFANFFKSKSKKSTEPNKSEKTIGVVTPHETDTTIKSEPNKSEKSIETVTPHVSVATNSLTNPSNSEIEMLPFTKEELTPVNPVSSDSLVSNESKHIPANGKHPGVYFRPASPMPITEEEKRS